MASALFKKFQDEQAKKDAEYKAWENDQWAKNGTEWAKEGYTRTSNPNSAWGSNWSYIRPENPPKDDVEQESAYAKAKREGTVTQLIGKEPAQEEVVTPIVEEEKVTPFAFQGDKYYWNERTFKNAFNDQFTNYLTGLGEDLSQYKYNLKDAFGRSVASDKIDITQHPKYQQYLSEAEKLYQKQTDKPLGFMYTKYKQGGTMNKVKYFSQGGAPTQTTQNQMSPEQELKAAAQFLQAVQAGDKKAVASLQQIQAAAEKGVPEAQRMIKLLEQASKLLQSAKWGSKLEYIRSLKFGKGGKSCPVCDQQKVEMKKCGGKKAKKHQTGGEFYFNETNPMRMSNGRNVVGIVNRETFKNPTNIGISQTVYNQQGRPVVQKDKTSNGGEREIYYNVPKSIKRKGFIGSRYEMGNDTVYVSGTPEMFQNSPNMSTSAKMNQANRFAYGM